LKLTIHFFLVPKIKVNEWARHVACMWKKIYACRWGKTEGKVTLRKPRRRWEDMMKMYLKETERENEEWMNLFRNSDKW
jgi:hypothetical protein